MKEQNNNENPNPNIHDTVIIGDYFLGFKEKNFEESFFLTPIRAKIKCNAVHVVGIYIMPTMRDKPEVDAEPWSKDREHQYLFLN